jgi:translation initiation factor IF-1
MSKTELPDDSSKKKNNGWSNKEAKVEVEGTIVKALPNLVFEVQLPDDFWWWIIQGYLGGKMRVHFIKLIPGDKVLVELSPYDLTKWRIVFRKK